MSIRALRTLVAIAQHGSFARAAEAVHLTQSAVSLHVRALEEELNVRLFDRSKRLPVLTDSGHLAVERAREVLSLYDSIAAELGDASELRGRLKLGVIQTTLTDVLPSALAALSQQHPQLRVNVTSGMSAELAVRIEAGELDAAVTTEPVKPYPYGLVSKPLYQEGFWIIAPEGTDASDSRRMLLEENFIRFDRRAWAGRLIDRELRRQRVRVQTGMELDSHTAIIRMVTSGLGVAIIPLSQHDLQSLGNVVRVPFGNPQMVRQVVLLERQDRPAGRLADALASAIRTQAGDWAIHEK
ncbi:Transcriptional regulator, LysR family [Stutzerimonas xanthomarina]|nr:Transcriptional regulator, LysR family [Stutzerimonas xanthomarina]